MKCENLLKKYYFCNVGIQLSTSEMEVLRKLKRNLAVMPYNPLVPCFLVRGRDMPPSFVVACCGMAVSPVHRYRPACLRGGADDL